MKNNFRNLSFYLLALNLKNVQLFMASRSGISEIPTSDLPKRLIESVMGERQLQSHNSSGISERSGKMIFHGHGVGTNHHKDSIFHFFRKIDKSLNKILTEKNIPLVIAGVDYLLPIYKQANKYPNLIEKGIIGNPERIGFNRLHKESLPIVASYYLNLKR